MSERDTKSGFSDTEREAMQQRAAELKAMKGVKGAAKKAKELEACIARQVTRPIRNREANPRRRS